MVRDLDVDESGVVSFGEFLRLMCKTSSGDSRNDIDKIFRLYTDNKSGVITFECLRRVTKELKEDISDEELWHMLKWATNGRPDQGVNAEQFYLMMTRT